MIVAKKIAVCALILPLGPLVGSYANDRTLQAEAGLAMQAARVA